MSLFSNDIILYRQNPKDSTKKLLELKKVPVKFQDTGLTCRNIFAFLDTNNELSERESKKKNAMYNNFEIIKYLGINLTKEVKDLYTENYKTSIKEIEDDTSKQIFATLMDWKNIVKMSLLSKEFCRFNVIPIELSKAFSQK